MLNESDIARSASKKQQTTAEIYKVHFKVQPNPGKRDIIQFYSKSMVCAGFKL